MVPEQGCKTAPPDNLVVLDEMMSETRKISQTETLAEKKEAIRIKLRELQALQQKVPSDESLNQRLEELWLKADDLLTAHFLD